MKSAVDVFAEKKISKDIFLPEICYRLVSNWTSRRTIQGVIKTTTKFSNVIGYQQPDLGINWTCSVRVMLVIGNYASFLREMLLCTLLSNLLGFSASITTF